MILKSISTACFLSYVETERKKMTYNRRGTFREVVRCGGVVQQGG
jgi:hypothetical protein